MTAAVREVTNAVHKLQKECTKSSSHSDVAYRTKVIINLAYDVAKACRHLVTYVEKQESSNP